MLLLLVVVLVVVPLVELAVIIQVAGLIGTWETIGLLLLVSVLGAALVKHQGLGVLRRLRRDWAERRLPGDTLADGGLVLLAGALLLAPGFVTDAVGLLLLASPIRRGVRTGLRRRWRRRLDWRRS